MNILKAIKSLWPEWIIITSLIVSYNNVTLLTNLGII